VTAKVVYVVEWIEVEFGQRSAGWSVFLDKERCMKDTRRDSAAGGYDGGYIGPVRPLCFFEVPYSEIPESAKRTLRKKGVCSMDEDWKPKFRGETELVDKPEPRVSSAGILRPSEWKGK
jgi:hypothetical protein